MTTNKFNIFSENSEKNKTFEDLLKQEGIDPNINPLIKMVKSDLNKAITLSSIKPGIGSGNLGQSTQLGNSNNVEDNEIIKSYKAKFEDLLGKLAIKQQNMQILFWNFVDLYNKGSLTIDELKKFLDLIIEDIESDFKNAQEIREKSKKFLKKYKKLKVYI